MFTNGVPKVNAILSSRKYSMKNKFSNENDTKAGKESNPFSVFDMDDSAKEERNSYELNRIKGKLYSGKKLTAKELIYLRDNAPELYLLAMKLKREREAFESKLRNAKSKEEVQDMYITKVGGINLDGRGTSDNSARINAIQDAFQEFKESELYKKLPDKKKSALNYLLKNDEKKNSLDQSKVQESETDKFEEVLEYIDGRYVIRRVKKDRKFDRKA